MPTPTTKVSTPNKAKALFQAALLDARRKSYPIRPTTRLRLPKDDVRGRFRAGGSCFPGTAETRKPPLQNSDGLDTHAYTDHQKVYADDERLFFTAGK